MIFGVDVAPVYQHRGCASYLLRRVILDSTIAGRKGIVLTCKERLVGFYSRLGFMDEACRLPHTAMWLGIRCA